MVYILVLMPKVENSTFYIHEVQMVLQVLSFSLPLSQDF